jgi:uncharacterized protein YggE
MATDERELRTVSVVGEGRAATTPDVATLQLGVETTDATLTTAQADNSQRSAALRARLRELGVEARDIQTSGYNVGQDHGPEGPIGYRVSNMVRITVRVLDRVGALLDAAIEAGANRVHYVGFGALDSAEAQHRAREAAMAEAQAKAAHYAALAGAQLGPVLAITESGTAPPPFARAAPMRAMMATTPIDTGEETITVTIQVTYALLQDNAQ